MPPSSPPDCESSSSALRAPRPGGPSAEPAAQVPAQAEAPIEVIEELESVVETLESVARGSLIVETLELIVAAAEVASTSEVALAVLAAVLRPAEAEAWRVEVALSTPLLTSAMLVFFRLSTEEVMPAAAAAEPAATVAEAESRALWSAPETASMPMPMPMPDARRRASMIQVLGRRAAHVVPRDRGSRVFVSGKVMV